MTDIEVLLTNFLSMATRGGSIALGVWAIYYFFKNLFGEGGRNPVKIAISVGVIVGAGAAWKLIPTLLQTGENSGAQITGNTGGSYSMPALGTLPSGTDTAGRDQAAFMPAAISATPHPGTVFARVDDRHVSVREARRGAA